SEPERKRIRLRGQGSWFAQPPFFGARGPALGAAFLRYELDAKPGHDRILRRRLAVHRTGVQWRLVGKPGRELAAPPRLWLRQRRLFDARLPCTIPDPAGFARLAERSRAGRVAATDSGCRLRARAWRKSRYLRRHGGLPRA